MSEEDYLILQIKYGTMVSIIPYDNNTVKAKLCVDEDSSIGPLFDDNTFVIHMGDKITAFADFDGFLCRFDAEAPKNEETIYFFKFDILRFCIKNSD